MKATTDHRITGDRLACRRRTLGALALAAGLAGAVAARAADVSWSVAADTAAFVGQETTVVYRPTVSPGAKLAPDALSSGTTSFTVVKAEARPDGTWLWTVLPLDEGRLSFVAHWTLDGRAVEAPPARWEVRSPPLPKDADIQDIKGPLAARRAIWPWLLAVALFLAVGYAGWWWRGRRRSMPGEPAVPDEPPLPPEAAAEQAIAALRASGLWERGEHAAYYLKLTDILRVYLEARYQEPATAMTSVEVARLIKAKDADLKIAAAVRELLSRADLVKFARITPGTDEGARDAELALSVVRATTPRPATVPTEAGAGAAASGEAS